MTDITKNLSKTSYALLIESVKDYAILILDTEGNVVTWNKGAELIKGYTANEIIGQHFSTFFTAEDIASGEPARQLEMARSTGKFEGEAWRVRKDGSLFWAGLTVTAMRDGSGMLIGYGKVTRDLTSAKMLEDERIGLSTELKKQLIKSRSEVIDYKHALDESSILAITDQKGIIRYANENFCSISKYSREELIGKDHRIINSATHSAEFIRDLWVTIANGKIWRGEIRNKAKDGSYYWVSTTIVPFLDESGKPYQYLAIRSDITQRKLAEEALKKTNETLELRVKERTLELTQALEREKELSEMKSRFVSMASHEFRTPLSAILSSSSLIEHYVNPGQEEKRNKHIERIKTSVSSLTNILDDFLSLEKLEQGKVRINIESVSMKNLLGRVSDMMEGMIKRKELVFDLVLSGHDSLLTDKKILGNILINLLSNAIKYSHDGGKVEVFAEGSDRQTVISVRDHGIGIPLEAQKDLFGKFFRAHNVVNIQGTGLGLNIVRRYVELLNGTIGFSSVENEGTIFTLTLPTVQDDMNPPGK
ncbi:MAG: PAS domain-containing sensor histidine kinase [Chitinophagaceae bacterium]